MVTVLVMEEAGCGRNARSYSSPESRSPTSLKLSASKACTLKPLSSYDCAECRVWQVCQCQVTAFAVPSRLVWLWRILDTQSKPRTADRHTPAPAFLGGACPPRAWPSAQVEPEIAIFHEDNSKIHIGTPSISPNECGKAEH